jgi:hypothetical protein
VAQPVSGSQPDAAGNEHSGGDSISNNHAHCHTDSDTESNTDNKSDSKQDTEPDDFTDSHKNPYTVAQQLTDGNWNCYAEPDNFTDCYKE